MCWIYLLSRGYSTRDIKYNVLFKKDTKVILKFPTPTKKLSLDTIEFL